MTNRLISRLCTSQAGPNLAKRIDLIDLLTRHLDAAARGLGLSTGLTWSPGIAAKGRKR
jgi:hypothetical protein